MPKNIEGVALFPETTRARFFELTTVGHHQLDESRIDFVTFDTLQKQHPDLCEEVTADFVSLKRVCLQTTEVLIREVAETAYHEGRWQVLVNRFKRELSQAIAAGKGSPDTFRVAYYNLSIGNLAEVLNSLSGYPVLRQRLTEIIEDGFPDDGAFQKIRQSQGFTVLQLGTLTGISTQYIEHMESVTGVSKSTDSDMKAKLMQHLFDRSFR